MFRIQVLFYVLLIGCCFFWVISCGSRVATNISAAAPNFKAEDPNRCKPRVYYQPSEDERCYYLQKKLIDAAENGNLEGVKDALQNGAHVSGRYQQSLTALYVASSKGNTEVVRFLIDSGAEVNKVEPYDNVALGPAIFYGHVETVKVLIEKGANVCIPKGANHLGVAKLHNYAEIVEILEDAGAENCR